MKNKHYKEWEKDFIRLAYPLCIAEDISKVLNRSKYSVRQIASNFKLKKPRNPVPQIGEKFGKLTVLKQLKYNKSGSLLFKCKCECGKTTSKCTSFALFAGKTKSCGCGRVEAISTSTKYISGTYIAAIKQHAKLRNIDYNIDINDLDNLLQKQKFKCALSNLPIKMVLGSRTKETTASLDRIDSSKSYTLDNVQWVHKDVNLMKMNLEENRLFELCELIYKHNKENII